MILNKILAFSFIFMLFVANLSAVTTKNSSTDSKPTKEAFYIGLGFKKIAGSNYTTNSDILPESHITSSYSSNILIGYNVLNWLAFEGELNTGFINQELSSAVVANKYNIYGYNNYYLYNAFINTVMRKHINKNNIPFIKFGVGYSKYISEFWHPIQNISSSGVSLKAGAGYEYKFSFKHALVLEYNYYYTRPYNDYSSHIAYQDIGVSYKYYLSQ